MLTGDNPLTAEAISKKIGIQSKEVLTGNEIEFLKAIYVTKCRQARQVKASN